ncbi:hypothetical protein HPB49_013625 [Dermacentor silvarum]|uniref:Uncharacterized protein n=1 Tax=Dermacentor silvarum TaxID=543639 RepID=A0ACB8DDJ4_DERSI|nr:hypothetical protein HPB49_013625 [Dermacentor silvarum]
MLRAYSAIFCSRRQERNDWLANVCSKARTIVGRYKQSNTTGARLQEIHKQLGLDPPLKLIQDVPTRWNREFAMIACLLKLKTAVTIDLTENDSV